MRREMVIEPLQQLPDQSHGGNKLDSLAALSQWSRWNGSLCRQSLHRWCQEGGSLEEDKFEADPSIPRSRWGCCKFEDNKADTIEASESGWVRMHVLRWFQLLFKYADYGQGDQASLLGFEHQAGGGSHLPLRWTACCRRSSHGRDQRWQLQLTWQRVPAVASDAALDIRAIQK